MGLSQPDPTGSLKFRQIYARQTRCAILSHSKSIYMESCWLGGELKLVDYIECKWKCSVDIY